MIESGIATKDIYTLTIEGIDGFIYPEVTAEKIAFL